MASATYWGPACSGAALSGAALSGAALSGTVLSGAVLSGAVLSGAVLSGAALSGADDALAVAGSPAVSPDAQADSAPSVAMQATAALTRVAAEACDGMTGTLPARAPRMRGEGMASIG